jgi:hypothetical protein
LRDDSALALGGSLGGTGASCACLNFVPPLFLFCLPYVVVLRSLNVHVHYMG